MLEKSYQEESDVRNLLGSEEAVILITYRYSKTEWWFILGRLAMQPLQLNFRQNFS